MTHWNILTIRPFDKLRDLFNFTFFYILIFSSPAIPTFRPKTSCFLFSICYHGRLSMIMPSPRVLLRSGTGFILSFLHLGIAGHLGRLGRSNADPTQALSTFHSQLLRFPVSFLRSQLSTLHSQLRCFSCLSVIPVFPFVLVVPVTPSFTEQEAHTQSSSPPPPTRSAFWCGRKFARGLVFRR